MSKLKLSLILITGIILSGCGNKYIQPDTTPSSSIPTSVSTSSEDTSATAAKKISLDEVKKHSSANDCWTIVDGNVYDITNEISKHPGGPKIINGCGIDSSTMYKQVRKHKMSDLTSLIIGSLE